MFAAFAQCQCNKSDIEVKLQFLRLVSTISILFSVFILIYFSFVFLLIVEHTTFSRFDRYVFGRKYQIVRKFLFTKYSNLLLY